MIFDASAHRVRETPHRRPWHRPAALVALLAGCLVAGACSATVPGVPRLPGQDTSTSAPGGLGGPGLPGQTAAPPDGAGTDAGAADLGTVEPYVVKGRVTTESGAPLAGVSVLADNTLAYNSNAPAVTRPDGTYRIELPRSDVYVWRMWGNVEVDYHGEHFSLELAVDKTPFGSAEGAIRDFTWKLSGLKDADLKLYYGGLVYVYEDVNSNDLFDKQWQITFTPQGPLIDGSTGETLTRQADAGEIDDVPVGVYTVTASYLPEGGGAPVPLLIRPRGEGEYASSATASFVDDSGPLMQIEIVEP